MLQVSAMTATWQAAAPESDLAAATPYPSGFAMTVGDFLITLPQLLEVLVPEEEAPTAGDGAAASSSTLATEWLDRAASGIVEELQQRVLAVPKLGSKVRPCMTSRTEAASAGRVTACGAAADTTS